MQRRDGGKCSGTLLASNHELCQLGRVDWNTACDEIGDGQEVSPIGLHRVL